VKYIRASRMEDLRCNELLPTSSLYLVRCMLLSTQLANTKLMPQL